MLQRAVAGGVTTVLYIPGSGTNSGGQGVLFKTGLEHYEDALVRDPGSLKIAQGGNPERWAIGVGKTFENYYLREMFERGLAYARAWEAYESGRWPRAGARHPVGAVPHPRDPGDADLDPHAGLPGGLDHDHDDQVEFGLNVFIDHGELGGYEARRPGGRARRARDPRAAPGRLAHAIR